MGTNRTIDPNPCKIELLTNTRRDRPAPEAGPVERRRAVVTRRGKLGGRGRAGVFGGAVVRVNGRGSPRGEQGAEPPLPERIPEDGGACSGVGEEGQERHGGWEF